MMYHLQRQQCVAKAACKSTIVHHWALSWHPISNTVPVIHACHNVAAHYTPASIDKTVAVLNGDNNHSSDSVALTHVSKSNKIRTHCTGSGTRPCKVSAV